MEKNNGLITHEDLKNYKSFFRMPIAINYKGHKVYTAAPPSGGGITLLTALGILNNIDIKKYKNDALAQPQSRKEFYKLINLDLIDVFKTTPKKQSYTFFDYKTYKFGKEEGIRIDFFLLSPFLKSKIMKLKVLKEYRDMDRPSDHCPILIDLNI
jgi:hypothetical protein